MDLELFKPKPAKLCRWAPPLYEPLSVCLSVCSISYTNMCVSPPPNTLVLFSVPPCAFLHPPMCVEFLIILLLMIMCVFLRPPCVFLIHNLQGKSLYGEVGVPTYRNPVVIFSSPPNYTSSNGIHLILLSSCPHPPLRRNCHNIQQTCWST